MVLRQEGSPFGYRLSQQGFIAGISHSLADIDDVVASIAHSADGLRHNVGSASTRTLFGGDREAFGSRNFAQARGVK